MNRSGSDVEIPVDQFDADFVINVRRVIMTAREAATCMQQAGRARDGRIVLISSITADIQTSGRVA